MNSLGLLWLLFGALAVHVSAERCDNVSETDVANATRIAFAFNKDGPEVATAVAHVINNRVLSPYFPNNTDEVVNYQWSRKNGKMAKAFKFAMKPKFTRKWQKAFSGQVQWLRKRYLVVQTIVEDALCGRSSDPTNGSLLFSRKARLNRRKTQMMFTEKESTKIGRWYFFTVDYNPSSAADEQVNVSGRKTNRKQKRVNRKRQQRKQNRMKKRLNRKMKRKNRKGRQNSVKDGAE